MPNAFGRAMLDQCQNPDRDVWYLMRRTGWLKWGRFPFRCRDLLEVQPEETRLIDQILENVERPRVLDIGCGVGRHLRYLQRAKPAAVLTGVEINDLLREYCSQRIPEGRFFRSLDEVPNDERFDLVLLMGNGMGMFGTEPSTKAGLQRIFGLLAEGGAMLTEAGNRYNRGFKSLQLVIEYQGEADEPFNWGYASERWLRREFASIGFHIRSLTPSPSGPEFSYYVAERPRAE